MSKKQQQVLQHSFGFEPTESTHHFLVHIPRGASTLIEVSEHFTWDAKHGSSKVTTSRHHDGQIKVRLARLKWDVIANDLRTNFNRRLRQQGRKSGSWKVGYNGVRRDLGKELVLLAWAIEDADPADPGLIPTAIANWAGLEAEERWWLYTQTAAATGYHEDRKKGWRKAIRFALTENPLRSDDVVVPEFYHRAKDKDTVSTPQIAFEENSMFEAEADESENSV